MDSAVLASKLQREFPELDVRTIERVLKECDYDAAEARRALLRMAEEAPSARSEPDARPQVGAGGTDARGVGEAGVERARQRALGGRRRR